MYSEITYCSLKRKSYSIPPREVEAFKILDVSFLQDTDLINSGVNDQIAFAEAGNSTILNARILPGSYTVANFPQAVGAAMTAVGSQSYVATYDPILKRLTISAPTKDFKILEGSQGTTAYQLLGMSRWAETGPGKSFLMKNKMNLSGAYPLLLCSNIQVQGARFLSDYNDSASSVLCSITPDSNGDAITWTNSGEFMLVGEPVSKIEFSLIDSYTGNEVSLSSPLTVRFAITDDVSDLGNR